MKRNRILSILLIIAAVAICSACAGEQRGLEIGNPDEEQSTITPLATYRNAAFGVEIHYDADWTATESADGVLFRPQEASDASYVDASFTRFAAPTTAIDVIVAQLRPGEPFTPYDDAPGFDGRIRDDGRIGPTGGRIVEIFLLRGDVLVSIAAELTDELPISIHAIEADDDATKAGETDDSESTDDANEEEGPSVQTMSADVDLDGIGGGMRPPRIPERPEQPYTPMPEPQPEDGDEDEEEVLLIPWRP